MVSSGLRLLASEPPFRYLVAKVLRRRSPSAQVKEAWDLSPKPAYMTGVLRAARQAVAEGVDAMSVIEFGVAGGIGLLALQHVAEDVEAETGVSISVYGFDSGGGLPELCGDYRDHPDLWKPGDYPMDVEALQAQLSSRTKLVLGNVADTVHDFFVPSTPPVGFISMDLDLYSSTSDALQLFSLPNSRMLKRCYLYFDDVSGSWAHIKAGELLAIEEFNSNGSIFIDRWRGLSAGRVFPSATWHEKMYVAHDLDAISATDLSGQATKTNTSL